MGPQPKYNDLHDTSQYKILNRIYEHQRTGGTERMLTLPHVIKQTGTGERGYDIFSRLLEDRIILLHEEITDNTAAVVIAELLHLESQDPNTDIQLYINSPGGSVSAGLAIYDTMQYIRPDVSTICMGTAASMGAFLLASGAENKRYCLPNAEVMIHQPLGGTQGQASDIEIATQHILQTKDRLNRLLAEHTGQTPEIIKEATDRNNWMSAADALNFGLIDKILTRN